MTFSKLISPQGEIPQARFGHTTTSVGNGKILMFGGAVGGSFWLPESPNLDVGKYTITCDLYLYNVHSNHWSRVYSENTPSPRAAHAAACVDPMQVVVFGGATGGGALSSDELYLLDLRRDKQLVWITVPTTGRSPGRRYGHTMVFSRPNLIVIGGNDGFVSTCALTFLNRQQASNDVWFLNVESSPFTWVEVIFPPNIKLPPKRVYHSADICKQGPAATMTVVFGGRTSDSKSLNDIWGLRQHRDGSWDWMEAPIRFGNVPESRYQHSASFIGSKLVIVGGRNDNEINRPLLASVYDTETLEWTNTISIQRFRHSCWSFGGQLYIFGGFSNQTQKHPTSELLLVDFMAALEAQVAGSAKGQVAADAQGQVVATAAPPVGVVSAAAAGSNLTVPIGSTVSGVGPTGPTGTAATCATGVFGYPEREIRLSAHAHAVQDSVSDFALMVRKVSIDKLEDEGKKINKPQASATLHWQEDPQDALHDKILRVLLNLNVTNDPAGCNKRDGLFPIAWKDIISLCQATFLLIKNEPTVLKLRAPIKVYGDIHGQYYDLMRLFCLYKCPLDELVAETYGGNGDLDSNDYLFLGDYVDRGSNSLEVIILLFALKCKYPTQIHLLRGNHEDPNINALYGFQDECQRRLREDTGNAYSCWQSINRIFEHMPLGAVIEDKILCIHGGIGKSITCLADIERIQRPVSVAALPTCDRDQAILDILWSDPTDSDAMLGTVPNEVRDPEKIGHIVKFGPDRVHAFLTNNDLQLIIRFVATCHEYRFRAHECVMDGFERFAGGRLITLFSATNYCNHYKNAGALLFIRRDLTIVPKLIYPSASTDYKQVDTWDMSMVSQRPPTPPRSAPHMCETNFGAP